MLLKNPILVDPNTIDDSDLVQDVQLVYDKKKWHTKTIKQIFNEISVYIYNGLSVASWVMIFSILFTTLRISLSWEFPHLLQSNHETVWT